MTTIENAQDTPIEIIRTEMLEAASAQTPYYFFVLNGHEAVLLPTTMSTEKIRNMTRTDVLRMAKY